VNPAETVHLARYVRAYCPQQKFDEYTPDAWHEVLHPYTLDEAKTAVRALITEGAVFVAPGEILGRIRKHRAQLLDRHTEVEPPQAGTLAGYRRGLLAERRAVASGQVPPNDIPPLALTGGPHRTVAQALADIGRDIPPDAPDPEAVAQARAIARAAGIYGIDCPTCQAPIGHRCRRGPLGKTRPTAHPERRRAAAGQMPTEEEQAAAQAEVRRRQEASRRALQEIGEQTEGEAS
jgi:hypothetical protein